MGGQTTGWQTAGSHARQLQTAACGGMDAPLPVELPHSAALRRNPDAGASGRLSVALTWRMSSILHASSHHCLCAQLKSLITT